MNAQDRYRQALAEMTIDELLDELTRSVLQNTYGSHDEQIAMIRQAVHARTN